MSAQGTASPNEDRRRRWFRRTVVALVVLVVLVVGGPFVFIHFIEGKAPAQLRLTSAGANGSSSGSVPLDGRWVVSSGSVVGYRVKEVLFGQDNTAVGRTSDVTGSLSITGTSVSAASFTVQMATVKSDFSQRDGQFKGRIMDVAAYPTARFVLSRPIKVGQPAASGVIKTLPASGVLTLRGQAREVTFQVQCRHVGTLVQVLGSVPIVFSRWGIPNPSFGFVTTQDHGTLEFLLDFRHAAKGATSSQTTTATTSAAPGAALAAYRACLLAHGVKIEGGPGGPGPGGGPGGGGGPGAGGGPGGGGSGGFRGAPGHGGPGAPGRFPAPNPKVQAAMKACNHFLPAGAGQGGPTPISVPRTTVPPLTL